MLLPQKWADPKNPWIPLSKCTQSFSRIMCIIISFEENWYDSVDSIKDLDEEALAKMKVPLRLIEVIVMKLGKANLNPNLNNLQKWSLKNKVIHLQTSQILINRNKYRPKI